MKISFYSYGWNLNINRFDIKEALDNWCLYADELVISVNDSTDGTYESLDAYAKERGYPVKLIKTSFDSKNDPFFYGKVVNAALQGCTGDLMVAQDFDERWAGDKEKLPMLGEHLRNSNGVLKAFFVPTVDLYGDVNHALRCGRKWYLHSRGLFRGPVKFGIKPDGRPNYNRTSTDELIDTDGNLVNTVALLVDLSFSSVREYVKTGLPVTYHLGYVNLRDRAERATWWKAYWENATGGDPNKHITSVDELLKANTFEHGLPLWKTS